MKPKLNGLATALTVAISYLKTIVGALLFALAFTFAICTLCVENNVYVHPGTVFFSILLLSFLTPFIPGKRLKGVFFAGLYREAFDKEIIKRFNTADEQGWRAGIRDIGKYFSMLQDGEVVVVNLAYFGVSPDVLINNTSYPIAIQDLNAENLTVTVNKFQTKATPITDDEAFGLNYDKIKTVQEAHAIKIEEEKNAKAIHSVGPASNVAAAPVLLTTGDLVGGTRRMMIKKDLLTLRDTLNRLKHPRSGRRLVLCNDHINDLLQQDEKFAEQYYNRVTGAIYNTFNFDLHESSSNPFYNATTKAKISYGAVPAGTDTEASVYFHMQRVVQGKGFTKAYLSPSSNDPLYQRTLLNYRHYDIVVPYKAEGIAAIASATS